MPQSDASMSGTNTASESSRTDITIMYGWTRRQERGDQGNRPAPAARAHPRADGSMVRSPPGSQVT